MIKDLKLLGQILHQIAKANPNQMSLLPLVDENGAGVMEMVTAVTPNS